MIRAAVSIAVSLSLIGCSSYQEPPMPSGNLVAVNKSLPEELIYKPAVTTKSGSATLGAPASQLGKNGIDKYFTKEQLSQYNKPLFVSSGSSATNAAVSHAKPDGAAQSNTASVAEIKSSALKKEPVKVTPRFFINDGETYASAISRWASSEGLSVVYSLPDKSRYALDEKSKYQSFGDSIEKSVSAVSDDISKDDVDLKFWAVVDKGEKAIIVHDIGNRYDVRLFTVRSGSLKDNAFALADFLGWTVVRDGKNSSWTTGTPNYVEHYDYKLPVSGDVARSYTDLLSGYNVQAQIDSGTKSIYFVRINK